MQAVSGFLKSVVLASLAVAGAAHAVEGEIPSCPKNVGKSPIIKTLAISSVQRTQARFSQALLKQLAPALLNTHKNIVMSPYSIATAMTLLRAGAKGNSARQLDAVLGYASEGLSLADILTGNQDLGRAVKGSVGGGSEIRVSNALWMGNQFRCNPNYQGNLKQHFGAPVEVVDFGTAAALATINRQISSDTAGMIDPFLDYTSSGYSSILTDAVYLDGSWETEFNAELKDEQFTLLDGTRKIVKMMQRADQFHTVQAPKYTSVRLPLAGGKLHVDLILPKYGLDAFIADLGENELYRISQSLNAMNLDRFTLTMPELNLDFSVDLIPTFKALGLKGPFEPKSGPDFSGMLSGEDGKSVNDFQVSLIKHAAKLHLDRKGVKAAATTGVGVSRGASRTVTFDRPFLLLIGDTDNNPLFVSAVSDPQ
jgi:serine protease inhibitor